MKEEQISVLTGGQQLSLPRVGHGPQGGTCSVSTAGVMQERYNNMRGGQVIRTWRGGGGGGEGRARSRRVGAGGGGSGSLQVALRALWRSGQFAVLQCTYSRLQQVGLRNAYQHDLE
jgi:hypothetical protein